MGITDRMSRAGARQAAVPTPAVPRPRTSPDTHEDLRPGGFTDFAHFFSRLRRVSMRTGAEGATFLLGTVDGRWHTVERDSPDGVRLLLYLGQLPGLDRAALCRPAGLPGVVNLWSADSAN